MDQKILLALNRSFGSVSKLDLKNDIRLLKRNKRIKSSTFDDERTYWVVLWACYFIRSPNSIEAYKGLGSG